MQFDTQQDELAIDTSLNSRTTMASPAATTSGAVAGPGPSSAASVAARSAAAASPSASPGIAKPNGMLYLTGREKKKLVAKSLGRTPDTYSPLPLPHYTITRAAHNSRDTPHVISLNPGVTDGSDQKWPSPEERKSGHKDKTTGRLSWYDCVQRGVGRHKSMRESVGTQVADLLRELKPTKGGKPEYWILEDLPEHYLFTVHQSMTGSGAPRTDVYIFGSPATVKFRTANEISPHIYWLMIHGPHDGIKCACKYCSKKLQNDVNKNLGLQHERASSVASSLGPPPLKPKRESIAPGGERRGFAEKKGEKFTPNMIEPADISAQGGDSLRGEASKLKELGKKCRSSTPGEGAPSSKKQRLSHATTSNGKRPSTSAIPTYTGPFVNRCRDGDLADLFSHRNDDLVWAELPEPLVPSPAAHPELANSRITHWPGIVVSRAPFTTSNVVVPPVPGNPVPPRLETTQEWKYDVRLFAVSDGLHSLRGDQLRTWLAHPPPTEFWTPHVMTDPKSVKHVWDGKRTRRDCKIGDFRGKLEEAVTAMALALQIAAHVVGSFAMTERYQPSIAHANIPANLSPSDKERTERQLRSWAFQCLHWGAERIWTGDFVRLMHSNTGPLPLQHEPTPGSLDRALFMKILALFKDQETGHLKIGGEVFELRDLKNDAPPEGASNGAMSMFEKSAPPPTSAAPSPAGLPPDNVVSGHGEVNGSGKGKKTEDQSTGTNGNGINGSANGTFSTSTSNGHVPVPASAASVASSLPTPPVGFEWRALSSPTHQITAEIEFLGGRYHPLPKSLNRRDKIDELLKSSLLAAPDGGGGAGGAASAGVDGSSMTWEQRAIVLAGLKPAFRLYMKCGAWLDSRHSQIMMAEDTAGHEVGQYFKEHVHRSGLSGNSSSSDGADTPNPE
ncbi:hypothetical protein JCM11641_006071 [Rhodosporidiobolus odoratus]